MSNNQDIFRVGSIGDQPVPCSMCVQSEAILTRDTLAITESAVVDNEDVRVQTAGESFVVLNTVWCGACGRVSVEEDDGGTCFEGLWDASL
jgi:hypothetical protein